MVGAELRIATGVPLGSNEWVTPVLKRDVFVGPKSGVEGQQTSNAGHSRGRLYSCP
jgi:hypothetical protein